MKVTVNKDGSITTSVEDEHPAAAESSEEAREAAEPEAKVVKSPAKPAVKARSTAESK